MSLPRQPVSAPAMLDQHWRYPPATRLSQGVVSSGGMFLDRDRLIAEIYAAAVDSSGWGKVFAYLSKALSGHTAIYECVHAMPGTLHLLATDLDQERIRSHRQNLSPREIWAPRPSIQSASLSTSERTGTSDEFERIDLYEDWMQPHRLKHAARAVLLGQPHRSLNFGLVRGEEFGPYRPEEVRWMNELLPHIRRAVEITARLEETTVGYRASLDTMAAEGTCLLVVNSSREIHFASPQAERLLQEKAVITTRAGRLCSTGRADASKLEDAISRATAAPTPAGSLLVLSGLNQTNRFSVAVTPVRVDRIGLFRENRLCIVRVAKPDTAGAPSVEALATLFGLTPTEARLAKALSAGETLNDYAVSNKVSIATVKTHLSALFSKTGVNRQIDLVRLIFADPIFSRSIN